MLDYAVVKKGNHNHNNKSYTKCVTKTRQLITSTASMQRQLRSTAKPYLQDKLDKYRKKDPVEDF